MKRTMPGKEAFNNNEHLRGKPELNPKKRLNEDLHTELSIRDLVMREMVREKRVFNNNKKMQSEEMSRASMNCKEGKKVGGRQRMKLHDCISGLRCET